LLDVSMIPQTSEITVINAKSFKMVCFMFVIYTQ